MITRKQKNRKRVIIALSNVVTKLASDLQIGLHDRNYVLRRLQLEGVKFLTVTLPNFSKFAIRCCADRKIDQHQKGITSFKWQRRSPAFLAGLLKEAVSGNPDSLYRIRQFCEYFYKTAFAFSDLELNEAQAKYVSVDESVKGNFDKEHVELGRKAIFALFPRLANLLPHQVFAESRPKDGPGSVARSKEWKFAFRLELEEIKKLPSSKIGLVRRDFAPFAGYFRSYPASKEVVKVVTESRNADLCFVPKDSRGPRTISKEPLHLIKTQMAFQGTVSRLLEVESNFRINFRSQLKNQELCMAASIDGQNATLDLKEASDRLGLEMARHLVRDMPALEYFLKYARSTHVRMEDA